MMKEYIYYPGCSVKTNAKHYEESVLPVFKILGMELQELPDWNCCGATASMSVDEEKAAAINGRLLSIAEKAQKDIIAPCAACYLSLKKANQFLKENSEDSEKILKEMKKLDLEYKGTVQVKHPVEVLLKEIGVDVIKEKVQQKLNGIKIASYYGCQVVRPFEDFDDMDYPESMDMLVQSLGVETVDFTAKTKCCGGALTANLEELGARLNYIILKEAQKKGADAIVTLCPLCLFNLEVTQDNISKIYDEDFKMPILFFSQLMGLAFGLPKEELGFSRSLIPTKQIWNKIEIGGTNV
ncbi:MAG: disulfide reductase [Candidatus Aminicenantes bacterium]|nr:disulfide reductase [Candidatus Aminicenantes bacterium]